MYVRGCEVEGMLDDYGKVIEETPYEPKPEVKGDLRTFRVWLDTNQYQKDMESVVNGGDVRAPKSSVRVGTLSIAELAI